METLYWMDWLCAGCLDGFIFFAKLCGVLDNKPIEIKIDGSLKELL